MYARVHNKVVSEILKPVEGFAIEDCFHYQVLAECIVVADDVQAGWVQQEDGSFAAPVVTPAETPTEAPSTTPVVAPAETPTEPTA